jgi:hypothetical protein
LAELSKTSQPGTFDAAGGRPPQHLHDNSNADRWIPAFAGMTIYFCRSSAALMQEGRSR